MLIPLSFDNRVVQRWQRFIKLTAFVLFILIFFNSCVLSFSQLMRRGETINNDFEVTVKFDEYLGLVIVPVEINGKTYRFLFDTGATTGISSDLNEKLNNNTIFRGGLIDSDKNRTIVKYVSVDSLNIGGISFTNQSAFVINFDKNPILKCMDLDGILGSNTIKNCNWKIDFQNKKIELTNKEINPTDKLNIPFKTDRQYNIKIDLKTGGLHITNLKLDYGSNGALSIPKSVIYDLKSQNIMTKITSQIGFSQSGITGEISSIKDLYGKLDSLYFNDLVFNNIPIKTGKGLIGTGILSNWIVEIDWDHQNLYFTKQKEQIDQTKTFGLFLNFTENRGVYVQSVILKSEADKKGIVPEMTVLKIGDSNLNNETQFCKSIKAYREKNEISMELINLKGDTLNVTLNKQDIDY